MSSGSVEAALDKTGGWTADRHFRLIYSSARSTVTRSASHNPSSRSVCLMSAAAPRQADTIKSCNPNGIICGIRFMKVMKAAKSARSGVVGVGGFGVVGGTSGGDGCRRAGRTALSKRLIAEMPELRAAEISRHESWYRLRNLHVTKKRIENEVLFFYAAVCLTIGSRQPQMQVFSVEAAPLCR